MKLRMRSVACAVATSCAVVASASDGTWVKNANVGGSPASAASWSDAANWKDGVVPSSIDSDTADLSAAEGQYISLGSGAVALKALLGPATFTATRPVLLGDGSLKISYAGDLRSVCLYSPWARNGGSSSMSLYKGIYNSDICGDCSDYYFHTLLFDAVRFRYDLYASAAGGVRANGPLPGNATIKFNGGASLVMTAPRGTDEAMSATFSQTSGSAFLSSVGAHETLPVGAMVTGEGIPDGTWLKRVFPDGGIELSAAVTATAASNALTFAPLKVEVTQSLRLLGGFNGAGNLTLGIQKYRAADSFRVSLASMSDYGLNSRTIKFAVDDGMVPGTLVVTGDMTETKYTWDLVSADIELAGGDLVGPKIQSSSATDAVRLSVPASYEQTVSNVTTFAGTLTTAGEGVLRLQVGASAFAATSKIVVEGGVFAPALAPGETAGVIPNLVVKKGGAYRPTAGVRVTNLTVEDGAGLDGEGDVTANLEYDNLIGSLANFRPNGGGYIRGGDASEAFRLASVSGVGQVSGFGDETVLTFAKDSVIRVCGAGTIDVLLVGGGGGGGAASGGGGGAGGFVYRTGLSVEPGVYSIAVGRGGAGGDSSNASDVSGKAGGATSAFGLTALGGGAGGGRTAGGAGGSGGGAGANYFYAGEANVESTNAGGEGTDGQGFGGGSSTNVYRIWSQTQGGGGGGAGGAGSSPASSVAPGGAGGVGRACSITGSEVVYAGGGGGGSGGWSNAAGGAGGGGAGGKTLDWPNGSAPTLSVGEDGVDGLGGGGGGGAAAGDYTSVGGAGGDGIVIVRFRPAAATKFPARGTLATGGEVKYRGGYEIRTFAEDGTFELSEDAMVDVLLVGGGGSGGYSGGGGGGGGVVVLTNCLLFAGTYQVGVGEGGAQPTKWGSNSGQPSFLLQDGFATTNLIAQGGGGGGSRGAVQSGLPGGSGGGACLPYSADDPKLCAGGKGVAGQGHDGGSSIHKSKGGNSTCFGGGGGGAGGAGANADGSADPMVKGTGGVGLWCDYSGARVCYGGGGSGGSCEYQYVAENYKVPAQEGGGGAGAGIKSPYGSGAYPGEDGMDGLGGGGGGGGGNADNCSGAYGGKGGKGVVIIRWKVRPNGMMVIVR